MFGFNFFLFVYLVAKLACFNVRVCAFFSFFFRLFELQSIEYGVQGIGLDGGNQRDSYTAKANSQSNTASSAQPKKTTWASIASQPVKSSQTRISSTLKKKTGMPSHIKVPPPPMIPGKHNMDMGKDSVLFLI